MAKKWICTVCGYVHEGAEPPAQCPQCKQPADKFKELNEEAGLVFEAEHVLGVARNWRRDDKRPKRTLYGRKHRGGNVFGYEPSGRQRRLS